MLSNLEADEANLQQKIDKKKSEVPLAAATYRAPHLIISSLSLPCYPPPRGQLWAYQVQSPTSHPLILVLALLPPTPGPAVGLSSPVK